MQSSTYAIKGSVGSELQKPKILRGFGGFRKGSSGVKSLCMRDGASFHGSRLCLVALEAEMGCLRMRLRTVFWSSMKARAIKAQVSDKYFGEIASAKPRGKSSESVLPYVLIACLGAILFGYHVGVVNGALEYLSKDLQIAENTVLQGPYNSISNVPTMFFSFLIFLTVLGTVLYVLSFSLGAGPVPPVLLPEIFSSRITAKAIALSLGMHWVSNLFIGLYFLSIVNKFGIGPVYLGFSIFCILAVLYVADNVVETKGRSLEEIV